MAVTQRILNIALALTTSVTAAAQGEQPNLIPNPGFEEFRARPLGWYYRGANFNRVIRYWKSPTVASPDAYHPDVRVPGHWADKGFGQAAPHAGGGMVGLTLYGCADGKPHCREYAQAQLIEPLVPGQRYRLSLWVAALPRGLRCDRLGAAFVAEPLRYEDDRLLPLRPAAVFAEIADPGSGWTQLTTEFVADGTEGYLVVGNFTDDAGTRTRPGPAEPPLPFAYYYVDDLSLRKVEPIVPVSPAPDALGDRVLRAGEAITLRHVYFDTDRDELQPRSFRELDQLVRLMRKYPAARVRIVGHTDDQGTPTYNVDLSQRRAARVVRYLEENGVAPERLSHEGRGETEPVASNDTPEGRQLNRRVVAEVL